MRSSSTAAFYLKAVIDDRFYNSSIASALDELATLLRRGAGLYPQFAERLASVEQLTDGIGWGFRNFIADVVGRLDQELGAS